MLHWPKDTKQSLVCFILWSTSTSFNLLLFCLLLCDWPWPLTCNTEEQHTAKKAALRREKHQSFLVSYRPLVPTIRSSGLKPHHILGMWEHLSVRSYLLDKVPVATAVCHQTCVYITPLSLQVIQHPLFKHLQAPGRQCRLLYWWAAWLHKCWVRVPTNGSLGRSLCCDTRRPHTHRVAVCTSQSCFARKCATEETEVWERRNHVAALSKPINLMVRFEI